jgi:outer membrane protein TolC
LDNNIPLELQADVVPEKTLENSVQENLSFPVWNENEGTLDAHPKIIALENKLNLLQIDRKLKANQLLPKANLGYSYLGLSNTSNLPFETNYKLGVQFSFPLFLRKERGSLKLTQLKIQESQWDLALEKQQLTNKIKAQQTEVSTLKKQLLLGQDLVNNYQLMVNSEERLFTFGESSVFLLNSRETSLVSAQLTAIQLENRYFQAQAELFKTAAQLSL